MGRIALLCISLSWLTGAAAQSDDPGRLYGTLTLRGGTQVTGALRWDGEELLWIHHFNGTKSDAFDLDEMEAPDRERVRAHLPGPQVEIDGHVVELAKWLGGSDLKPQFFGLEFGAISELQPGRGERVTITLRDGSQIKADGGSNDIGEPDIEVLVGDGSRQSIDWDDIERIRLHAPAGPAPQFPPHLFARVQTDGGDFEGFIEWDHDERRADERLDYEVDGNDEEFEFGSIRSIAKDGSGSRVTLKDGQSKWVTGTNDVNSENRGVVVTGPAFGQIDIPWSAFRSASFAPAPATLPGFADFAPVGPLRGRVAHRDGRQFSGAVVFDLDQFHQAETLEGRGAEGIQYRIPLRLIAALEPLDPRSSRVHLRAGTALVLGVRNDVTGDNNGLAVRVDGGKLAYVAWADLQRIEFE